ncbi:T9SS type A sorting domain-containing protein [Flavobacterium sangjuense]|uniref:Secretion system C-terminal sorting domain-containing protein n=1 Tax=Flavobacterium sangjuense TaxID=2518177 RepID=A0A4V1CCB6_9FLAO|nr:T9SS type A sorting domain-containing protein [Flavobacterium sangjuense]QBZ98914.1 hypothetical protein GS03_02426 [Flavobacterium sangjuense]
MKKITLLFSLFCIALAQAQVPSSAAPTPPVRNAADVISIYGSAYSNIAGVNTNPFWGQSTVVTEIQVASDNMLQYANFNYQGTDWAGNAQNISTMEYLHVDVWTNNQSPNVFAISTGPEIAHPISSVAGSWQSLDFPLAGFTGNLSNVIQFKFDGGTGGTIYLDNLYFWKAPVAAGTDATLSDLRVDGTTVSGFASNIISYTKGIPFGTPTTPQITLATTTDPGATTVITQASGVPGSATVVVTSQNTLVTKTYTVSFVYTGPTSAAPTPPNRNASDVISLFSNAYTNTTIETWSAVWDDSDVTDMQVAGDDVKKISFGNFIGVEFVNNRIDASTFTNFHMDFWTDNADLIGKVFNSKFSQWGGGAGEVSALELNINTGTTPAIVTGAWVSIDVPFSSWSNNLTRNDLAQFLITSNLGVVYVDNIYIYKGIPLATNDFVKSSLRMYPNPANEVLNISSESTIDTITVYNTLGQIVSKQSASANEATINVSSLSKGVYILTAQVGNELIRKQFIKE